MKLLPAALMTALLAVAVALAQTSPPPDPSPPPAPPSVPVSPPPPSVPPAPLPPAPLPPAPPSVPTPTQPQTPPPSVPVTPPPAPTPPAPKPVKPAPPPAKPAPKPATAVKPLELVLDTTEPEIRGGELRDVRIVRVWKMPLESVNVSRQYQKISSGIEAELQKALRSIRRETQDAVWYFDTSSKGWVAKQQSGWSVDAQQTRALLLEAIKYNKSLARVALRRLTPGRNVQDWYARGIRYHFGGGDSSFRGSPSFRVQNIIAGSRQIDNTYLKAGEVFDFNARVKISAALGFVEGYIISGGTLAKDIGGGICQVSTTVWRAAYQAGLPIVQRNNHSYRVHYYDPPGFEATVFSPYKNLKFRNDTGSDMFIQMTWYTRSQRLELHFFGARPDRKVSITDPYIYNVRPPAGPRYQADPNVRLGRVRRIDSPERGMSVRINRTVRYDDGRSVSDVTRSTYVPWGAIYAVNPNDYRVAPPKPKVAPKPVIPPAPAASPATPTPPASPAANPAVPPVATPPASSPATPPSAPSPAPNRP